MVKKQWKGRLKTMNEENKYSLTPEYVINAQKIFEVREVLFRIMNDVEKIPTDYVDRYNGLIEDSQAKEIAIKETKRMMEEFQNKMKDGTKDE